MTKMYWYAALLFSRGPTMSMVMCCKETEITGRGSKGALSCRFCFVIFCLTCGACVAVCLYISVHGGENKSCAYACICFWSVICPAHCLLCTMCNKVGWQHLGTTKRVNSGVCIYNTLFTMTYFFTNQITLFSFWHLFKQWLQSLFAVLRC